MLPGPLGGHILIKNGRTDPKIQKCMFTVFFRILYGVGGMGEALYYNLSLDKLVIWEVQVRKIEVIWGVNGGGVGRHGLILWENGATGSRKVFRCLLDLWEAIF